MIAQCVRNDSMLLLGQSQRLFSRCTVLKEKGASSYHFTPHSRGFLRTSLPDDKPPVLSQLFFSVGQKEQGQHRNKARQLPQPQLQERDNVRSKWSSYTMPSKEVLKEQEEKQKQEEKHAAAPTEAPSKEAENPARLRRRKNRRTLRPRKALISLSPRAMTHLRSLLDQPEPKLIRIGVTNRGCSGLSYDLQYITEPGKYDEIVEQDGIKVIVDSKALFSVVGSEMDWIDDRLSSRFVFRNPNSKGTCGCGESFMV
ncbi:hypothetical protein ZYGR_0E00390 [Zygosaccharomyces rouxii]|uniref:Iron-sulfur assembly protein 1 n=2 Tax=Zygosaccharomyces rouxii TaxID=4956 RepID=C5DQK0_ZYGRC|nr:uncharacterized protein ZYRO0B00968g [Zygosaccharomyces rouxii]KAH9200387.1 hypothetical protein LQ764DRAFT_234839 [Zygosaccharomyces rouxii]GAV47029.1 hypothetical protein ZYGR_0E00390 [Zygosaccharomyces rouxii]CAR26061.1 ZYRO0B00968p [Zygosaccharomyces rouxii]